MSKQGITKRALQKYHSYNTKYFPMLFARLLFENSAPFFNLWMSSEIITALYEGKTKKEQAKIVGTKLAEKALAKGIDAVVFDRGGYIYHGRVKELAEGAREGGLKF